MKTLLLKNASVVLADREVRASVLIDEGRIVSLNAEHGDEELDLAGTTLLPGFIDPQRRDMPMRNSTSG